MNNWKTLILEEMKKHNESFNNIELCTLTEDELLEKFDCGYGCVEGKPFTLWTHKRVYFPIQYDGAEWVGSVSRHPDNKPTVHLGSG